MHNFAIKKGKVIACSCHLIMFINYLQSIIRVTHALQRKELLYNYEYDYVVCNGTMM
jgi:hypothetical protein